MSLPTEPPLGLLVSMAIRSNHGLAIPGYYDQPLLKREGVTHARMFEATVQSMRQLYEEVAGTGFYSPDREAHYLDLYNAAITPADSEL